MSIAWRCPQLSQDIYVTPLCSAMSLRIKVFQILLAFRSLRTFFVLRTGSLTSPIFTPPQTYHWETMFFHIVPLLKPIIWAQCWFTICLRRLGSGSLLRALIRSGYWDCIRPSFISQYGLFPGIYSILSNTLLCSTFITRVINEVGTLASP